MVSAERLSSLSRELVEAVMPRSVSDIEQTAYLVDKLRATHRMPQAKTLAGSEIAVSMDTDAGEILIAVRNTFEQKVWFKLCYSESRDIGRVLALLPQIAREEAEAAKAAAEEQAVVDASLEDEKP